jgi:hypothetical protein
VRAGAARHSFERVETLKSFFRRIPRRGFDQDALAAALHEYEPVCRQSLAMPSRGLQLGDESLERAACADRRIYATGLDDAPTKKPRLCSSKNPA